MAAAKKKQASNVARRANRGRTKNKGATKQNREEKARRIQLIAQKIQRLQWEPGESDKYYALEWGVSKYTVQDYASEARRMIALAHSDKDLAETRQILRSQYEHIARDAMIAKQPFCTREGEIVYGEHPDRATALNALNAVARILRLDNPSESDILEQVLSVADEVLKEYPEAHARFLEAVISLSGQEAPQESEEDD